MKIEITDIPKSVNKIVIDVFNNDFSVNTYEPTINGLKKSDTELKKVENPIEICKEIINNNIEDKIENRESKEIPEEMNSDF